MSEERHQRLQEIFLRARVVPPEERAAFLDEACRHAPDLRSDLDKLLAHDAAPVSFVDQATSGRGAAFLARELAANGEGDVVEENAALPARIGRYEIIRIIDRGGMGIVYEAEQDEPRRRVALKVIRPGLVTSGMLKRFRLEAEVLGRLGHPGIAQIHEAGTADGQPFFAMELVDGRPLLEHADGRALSLRDRMALVARVCDALHHAHLNGVIHRDLKPSNILVSDDGGIGQPRILDFGIARATDADVQAVTLQTDVGELIGTLPYMSPEQAAGDPALIDTRTDIYSLGVLAFELISGRRPHDLSGRVLHDAVREIREAEPTRLSTIDRGLRGDVETIVAKALEKEKERRYQSAADFAADIRRYLVDQPIVARPASGLYQLRKFVRRNRTFAAATLLVFISMAAATVISAWQWRETERQRGLASDRADALETARWNSYRTAVASAASAIELGDPVVAARFLDVAGAEQAGWEHRYLTARLETCVARFELESPVRAATFLGETGEVVCATSAGTIERWDPDLGEHRERIEVAEGFDGAVSFSSDGSVVVAALGPDDAVVAAWDTVPGERRGAFSPARPLRRKFPLRLAVGPRGDQALVGTTATVLWNTAGADSATTVHDRVVSTLAFGRDGRHFVVGFRAQGNTSAFATVVDLGTTPPTKSGKLRMPNCIFVAAAVSHDGRHAVLGADDGRVWIFDGAMTRGSERLLEGHEERITAVAIAPDGRTLATAARDQTIREWDLESALPIRTLIGSETAVEVLAYDSEGARLLAGGGKVVRIFEPASDNRVSTLRGHQSYVYGVAFVDGDERVVSGGWDGDLRSWDAGSGSPLEVIDTASARVQCLAVAADAPVAVTGHEHRLIRWDPRTWERTWQIDKTGRILDVAISGDGSLLAARTMTGVAAWDGETGSPRFDVALGDKRVNVGALALSPDTSVIAACNRGRIALIDTRTGLLTRHIAAREGRIDRLAFGPTGSTIACGGANGAISIWDVATGDKRAALDGHAGKVFALAFSPDGTRLASGSDDRTIRLWDASRGEQVLVLNGHEEYVYDLAFSPDGSILVSASGDRTVRVWDTRPDWERWRERAILEAKNGAAIRTSNESDPTPVRHSPQANGSQR